MDRAPEIKRNEQHPSLKVDGGGGGGGASPPAPTIVNGNWGVTRNYRQSWFMRWPEYFSACWMSFILLSICFSVFYTIGLETRKHSVLVMKCNHSKPASNVYYHHIVQRGTSVPFVIYAEYLSSMALQYPSLNFHVLFLLDDSLPTAFRGARTRFFSSLIPMTNYYSSLDDLSKYDLAVFQTKYQNVNVTIMPLSKYMATTPLKYKWRLIPIGYLPFYARIFSVWQNGGIGMDLYAFNNYYNKHQRVDKRITAILKQHNNGIKIEDYKNALDKINEEREVFNLLGWVEHISSLICKSFTIPLLTTEKIAPKNEPLVRKHRNKREVLSLSRHNVFNESESLSEKNIDIEKNDTDIKNNKYYNVPDITADSVNYTVNDYYEIKNVTITNTTEGMMAIKGGNQSTSTLNKSDVPQEMSLYFTIYSDQMSPFKKYSFQSNDNINSDLLSIDFEGSFVAATSKYHPFLGNLISASYQRLHPAFAINELYRTQCSQFRLDYMDCNNIYLL